MKITYDRNADAAYLRISNHPIKETRQVSEDCNIDLDSKGRIAGIELLFVSEYSPDFKLWLSVASLAGYLQKSEVTIRRWTKAGELPSYKIGGEYYFVKEEIDEYIKKSKFA
jgi:excisionase family DNA binding protein